MSDILRPHETSQPGQRQSQPVQRTAPEYDPDILKRQSAPDPVSKSSAALQRRLNEVEESFRDLDKDLRDKTDSDPVEVCNAWCARQAEAEYPGIGKTPHAVPDHFIGAHKAKKLCPCDITDRENSFFENAEQYSQVRGDKAQRTIGRAFRMLSAVLEKEGKSAMFIISQLSYDNLLAFLRRCGKLPEGFRKQFEKVFADEPSYINIPAHLEQRGELDLMILHEEKGVIFVQIKGILNEKEQQAAAYKEQRETGKTEQKVTTEVKQAKATIQKKIKNAEKQLDHDVCIFECLMSRSGTPESHGEQVKPTGPPPVKVTRVVALPNLTKKDIEDNEIESKQDSLFLLKEDLFEEDMNLAECETDLSNFRRWWDRLPAAPMRRDYMQEIVGKYIGPFSSALTSKDGNERERQRQYRDSVQRTALLLSRNMLSRRQLDILKISDPKETKRVYLSGPPGSGKTVLLTSKARSFLETSEKHHVIVLNMYRGAAGRAIGERIFTAVSSGGKKQRVHKVDVDVTEGSFDKANFVKGVKRLNPGSKHWLKNALFIVDEIYVESFWQKILNAFKSEFSESSVWCAGLFSRTPTGFREYKLYCVYRCPPSVQNLLYQVDWDDTRKTFYKRDAEQAEVPTNGPIPLCILHEKHANVSVTECVQCAEELAVVLNDKKLAQLVQPRENPSEPGGASSTPDLHADYSDIKLTFLVNLPRELYERNVSYLETSKARYTKYMDYVARCPFIKTLIEKGVDVDVKTDLACKDLNGPCTATWLYNFQGLETTVVVFLPGDTPRDGRSQASAQRDIPAPGLRTKDFEGDADFDLPVVRKEDVMSGPLSTDTDAGRSGNLQASEAKTGTGLESTGAKVSVDSDAKTSTDSRGAETKIPTDSRGAETKIPTDSRGAETKIPTDSRGAETKIPTDSRGAETKIPTDSRGAETKIPTDSRGAETKIPTDSRGAETKIPTDSRGAEATVSTDSQAAKESSDTETTEASTSIAESREASGHFSAGTESSVSDTRTESSDAQGPSSKTSDGSSTSKTPANAGSECGNTRIKDTGEASTSSGGRDRSSSTSLQWTSRDIERYSPWDKTNVMVGGSRCLSLLILIVP